jgi:hypothetical protein
MKLNELFNAIEQNKKKMESATAGATASGNIATVVSPQLAIGKGSIGNKSYTGSPGKSGTSAPKVPKIVQKKKKNGTAVNALDMKGHIFGGGNALKR